MKPVNLLFYSHDAKEIMALNIVKDIRNLDDFHSKDIFGASTSAVRDRIVNTFYRPQILIPNELKLKKGSYQYNYLGSEPEPDYD